MIEWILLGMFALTCALLLKDGFQKPASVLELPFLAGVGVSSFLLLQAIGVVRSGSIAPSVAVCKALLMCILCCLALRSGWNRKASLQTTTPTVSAELLYVIGLIMLAIGFWGKTKLAALSGGVTAHYSVAGSYALEWRGLPVIYVFFANYLEPGILFCALASLRLRSLTRFLAPLGGLVFVIADVLFLGRRTKLGFLLIALGLSAYFGRGWTLPRPAVILGAFLAGLSLFVMPYYRANSQLGGDREALADIRPTEIVREVFNAPGEEFVTAAFVVQITEEERLFQYGIGFYNSFVRYFVPKTLVGEEGKSQLLIDMPDAGHVGPEAGSVPNRYNWTIIPNIVPTGPASAFQQFWYIGCFCFYLMARWLRNHWIRAVTGDLWSQIIYAVSVTYAVAAIVNDIYAIYIPLFMFILPGALVSRLMVALSSRSHGRTVLREDVLSPTSRTA